MKCVFVTRLGSAAAKGLQRVEFEVGSLNITYRGFCSGLGEASGAQGATTVTD